MLKTVPFRILAASVFMLAVNPSTSRATDLLTCHGYLSALTAGNRPDLIMYLIPMGRDAGGAVLVSDDPGEALGDRFEQTMTRLAAGTLSECEGHPTDSFDEALNTAFKAIALAQLGGN